MLQKTIRVLVVDDRPLDASLLRDTFRSLSSAQFDLEAVTGPGDVGKVLKQHGSNVVTLSLPVDDTVAASRRIASTEPKAPIVVLSGIEHGALAIGHVKKPGRMRLIKQQRKGTSSSARAILEVERRRAKRKMRRVGQKLALAMDASGLGFWDWDPRTDLITFSERALQIMGMSPEQNAITCKAFNQTIHSDDRDRVNKQSAEQFAELAEHGRYQFRIAWPNGSIHWIESRSRVLFDSRRRIKGMIGTMMDITTEKADEELSLRYERELAHLSRISTMGQMASGIAHELNQPLASIVNYSYICLEQFGRSNSLTPIVKTSVDEIMSEARRGAAIIDRLRSFMRPREPTTVKLDINQKVSDALHIMQFELRRRQISPEVQTQHPLPMVLADSVGIEQVLVNLLFNALDAIGIPNECEPKLIVRTELGADGKTVDVSVIDSGSGVQPENIERLFSPFFTTKPNGLGIGLNICRSIVESYGGTLTARPNPDRGMCFCFSLRVSKGGAQ